MSKEIAIIGGGNMGRALAEGLTNKQGKKESPVITVANPHLDKIQDLQEKSGISITTNNKGAVEKADVVVVAVKPQIIAPVLEEIGEEVVDKLLVSVAAGTTIKTIKDKTENPQQRVVRAMPNLGVETGYGMTVWTASKEVTQQDRKTVKEMFNTVGRELYVSNEDAIDVGTAIAGSGPAYYFSLTEALEKTAGELGLSHDETQLLVKQTFLGAAHSFAESGKTAAELRKAVTSKGGTTEAAIKVFEQNGFTETVIKGAKAAHERSKQLSKSPPKQ